MSKAEAVTLCNGISEIPALNSTGTLENVSLRSEGRVEEDDPFPKAIPADFPIFEAEVAADERPKSIFPEDDDA